MNTKTGKEIYDELISSTKRQGFPTLRFSTECHSFTGKIILPKDRKWVELDLMDSDLMSSMAHLVAEGITASNETKTDKPEYFIIENSNGKKFEEVFPNHLILSRGFDEEMEEATGECFLINTVDDNYPVLFFGTDGVTFVSDDLASFLKTLK